MSDTPAQADASKKFDFSQLATKSAAKAALDVSKLDCEDIFKICLEGLKDGTQQDEAETIGALNLLAVKCEEAGSECKKSPPELRKAAPECLLRLLCCRRDDNDLLSEIKGKAPASDDALLPEIEGVVPNDQNTPHNHWANRRKHWSECISEKLARTRRGQVLVMHVLAAVLPVYDRCKVPRNRTVLNLLLVPLFNDLFTCPDRAHQAYATFFFGQKATERTAFDRLYNDIEVIEHFQARELFDRSDLLAVIRKTVSNPTDPRVSSPQEADDIPELPEALKDKINAILHGTTIGTSNSKTPHPKMTRISQITCLIRKLIGNTTPAPVLVTAPSQGKHYVPVLDGVHYRCAVIGSAETPSECCWQTHDMHTIFRAAVKARYRHGYNPEDLDSLFSISPQSDETMPVWMQDGEVSFLWLLTALAMSGNEWLNGGGQNPEPTLTYKNIASLEDTETRYQDLSNGSISFGSNIKGFITDHLCLFNTEGNPTAKAWALFNFLERVVLAKKPQWYETHLSQLITDMYSSLTAEPGPWVIGAFIEACNRMKRQMATVGPNSYGSVVQQARVSTFALELILRDRDPTPYSLFFYPFSFSKSTDGSYVLPEAFLAGTYAGLEWSSYPSVTALQNYHLFAMLDAIHPIIHFDLGRVLAHDEESFQKQAKAAAEAEGERRTAEDRRRTFEAVIPAVKDLTKLFRNAQSRAYQIESAVDMEWGGLFGETMCDVFTNLFTDNKEYPITTCVPGELSKVMFTHSDKPGENDMARQNLLKRLFYLAREVCGYKSNKALLCGDNKNANFIEKLFASENHPELFRDQPFLRALTRAFLGAKEKDYKTFKLLNDLLKLFTVAVADPQRGVHLVQLAAAIGTRFGDKATKADVLSAKEVSINPRTDDGVLELSKLLGGNPQFTVMLRDRDLAPVSFLRSLGIISARFSEKSDNEPDRVCLLDASDAVAIKDATDSGDTKHLRITLKCAGRFPQKTKAALWEYQKSDKSEYHDLRTNFSVLCRAINGFPLFHTVPSGGSKDVASQSNPFLILESVEKNESRSTMDFFI